MPHTRPFQEIQDDKFTDLEVPRQTFPESVVPDVASVLGARSFLAGIASAVRSLLGLRLEAPPPTTARAQEQPVSLMDADARVEPPTSLDASVLHDDASHDMPINAGANGPAPDAPHSPPRRWFPFIPVPRPGPN